MARKVRDKKLDSAAARTELKPRGKPYWRQIDRGLHLGYRRLKGKTGTWWARHYLGDRKYEVEGLGGADDRSDADGFEILSYWQAQDKARARVGKRVGKNGRLTVKVALKDYVEWLEANRKSANDARQRVEAFVLPELGEIEVASLTTDQLRKWHAGLAREAPRVRTAKGKPQRHRPFDPGDPQALRRRKASANRVLTILKGALNRAWRDEKVPSDAAWRRVEPFENVDASRVRYLTVAEAERLINACDVGFRPLVEAALQTGARYGEVIRLKVHDYNPDAGTIAIRESKSGKPRHVVLTEEGIELFGQLTAGRIGEALIFRNESRRRRASERREDAGEWRASEQGRPISAACQRAKISPPISFHTLRHTWASLAVMGGVPLLVVAKNLGHSDTRMVERHYGHLAPSYVADAIRAGAPRFGSRSSNVTSIVKARS